jgi:hypothetical protein
VTLHLSAEISLDTWSVAQLSNIQTDHWQERLTDDVENCISKSKISDQQKEDFGVRP